MGVRPNAAPLVIACNMDDDARRISDLKLVGYVGAHLISATTFISPIYTEINRFWCRMAFHVD